MGTTRNWPSDPAAVPTPNAQDLFSSGTSRPKAASTIENEDADIPRPIKKPPDKWSIAGVPASAIRNKPAA